jgi:hypothetical protein
MNKKTAFTVGRKLLSGMVEEEENKGSNVTHVAVNLKADSE